MVEFFEITFDSILIWAIALFGIGAYIWGIYNHHKAGTKLKTDVIKALQGQEELKTKTYTEQIATQVKERADTIHQQIRDELAEVYEIAMSDVRATRNDVLDIQVQMRAMKTSLAKQGISIENGGDAAFEREIARKRAAIDDEQKKDDDN